MKKNIETKKRYAVGFYNAMERISNPKWMKNKCNRLVTFIYDNQDMFDIRYICHDKEGNRAWFIIDTKELLKAKEGFMHEDSTEVLEWIDICVNYDAWKTSCTCCDSISLNTLPYTYRDYGGCIGKEYNCPMCSGLSNKVAYLVREKYNSEGLESAIDFLIAISEGEYVDEEEKYHCACCGRDSRKAGIVKDSEMIYKRLNNGKYEVLSVEDYNKREIELEKEIEGYYPEFYYTEEDNPYLSKVKVEGYTCFECGCKVDEVVVEEILSNTITA